MVSYDTKITNNKNRQIVLHKIKNFFFFSMDTIKKVKEQITREKTYVHTEVCIHIFISALFIMGKNITKYLSVDE